MDEFRKQEVTFRVEDFDAYGDWLKRQPKGAEVELLYMEMYGFVSLRWTAWVGGAEVDAFTIESKELVPTT